MSIPNTMPPTGNNISEMTEGLSLIRNNQIESLLYQHLGPNWTITIFLSVLFIFGIITLIIFGLSFTPNEDDSATSSGKILQKILNVLKPHLKVFIIIIILSFTFFILWTILVPENPADITYSVVPYPSNNPLVPPDSTLCGTSIVKCTSDSDCASQCTENNGTLNYTCLEIPAYKNVWYEGSKLISGQSYCLPKTTTNALDQCSTYTGRAIYTYPKGWVCECMYPDLFSGNDCKTQTACATDNSTIPTLLTNGKLSWDLNNFPAGLVGKTPYDKNPDGSPEFTCGCPSGYNVFPGDPYVCHKDVCYSGNTSSSSSFFDKNNMQCSCDGGTNTYNDNRTVFQSNVTGFCFPYGKQETIAKPHVITGRSTFGFDPCMNIASPVNIIISLGGKATSDRGQPSVAGPEAPRTCMSFVSKSTYTSAGTNPVTILVDIGQQTGYTPFTVDDNTNVLGLFNAFPILKFNQLSPADQANAIISIKNALTLTLTNVSDILQNMLIDIETNTGITGYVNECDSYYYNSGTGKQCIDTLSPEGIDFTQVCEDKNVCGTDQSGNPIGTCQPIVQKSSPYNYNCKCSDGYAFINGICQKCYPDGHNITENIDPSTMSCLCCSKTASYTLPSKVSTGAYYCGNKHINLPPCTS